MRLKEIRLIARERGIETKNRKKEELILAILEGERKDSCTEPTSRSTGQCDAWWAELQRL